MIYVVTAVHGRLGPLLVYANGERQAFALARAVLDRAPATRLIKTWRDACPACHGWVAFLRPINQGDGATVSHHANDCSMIVDPGRRSGF